jgi:hypothetical protein
MSDHSPAEPLLGNSQPSPRRSPRQGWIWFFVILFVLAVAAVTIQVWYNVRNQLTHEQLARARALWNAKGPADYDMHYVIHKLDSKETYDVKVRNGKAVSVICNGQPLEERLFRYSEMRSLYDFIEGFLEQDSEPGRPRTFATATFDPNDGHLLRYVRSVTSTRQWQEIRERQEIEVTRFERVSGSKS